MNTMNATRKTENDNRNPVALKKTEKTDKFADQKRAEERRRREDEDRRRRREDEDRRRRRRDDNNKQQTQKDNKQTQKDNKQQPKQTKTTEPLEEGEVCEVASTASTATSTATSDAKTFAPMALYIRRLEFHQTKDFVAKMFASQQIGVVREVVLVPKQGYNGAQVFFAHWNRSAQVSSLLDRMHASPDGTTRFYFDASRYWVVNVHKPPAECAYQMATSVDPTLPAAVRATQLDQLVNTMAAQMYRMQQQMERMERAMMEKEHQTTVQQLHMLEMESKLVDMQAEMDYQKDESEFQLAVREEKLAEAEARLQWTQTNLEVTGEQLTSALMQLKATQEDLRDEVNMRVFYERRGMSGIMTV